MGARLWDEVWGPLLISVAIDIIVAALCFLSVRLWNCLRKLIKTQTAVGESAHDQPLPDSDAHAHGVRDLEIGNRNGPAQGIEHFSDQEAHTPVIISPATTPKAHVTRNATRGALVPVEMDVPHSAEEEVSPWSCTNVSCVANVPSPDDPTSLSYTVPILEGLTV